MELSGRHQGGPKNWGECQAGSRGGGDLRCGAARKYQLLLRERK